MCSTCTRFTRELVAFVGDQKSSLVRTSLLPPATIHKGPTISLPTMGNCQSTTPVVVKNDDDSKRPAKKDVANLQEGLLRERNLDVYSIYQQIEILGQGSMGQVVRVRKIDDPLKSSKMSSDRNKILASTNSTSTISEKRYDKVEYGLKSIHTDRVSPQFLQELKNEIEILRKMDHPNIVKAHEVYHYKKHIYIILELCDGGDLYSRLPYSEKRAASITGKLMSAIKYLHDHGIVHRDLKFENVMFESKADDAEIKLIDFGLSKKFLSHEAGLMYEGVGTLYSMSPQVLQGVYTSQADLWSCGVITYMLLSSHRPFYHKERAVMIDRIMRVDYSFDKDYWEVISDEAKNFIDRLLVLDPNERMDAGQALEHPWLSKEFPLSDRVPDQSTADAVQGNLVHYREASQLKKIALNVIAHQSTTKEIAQLRKVFDQFDRGNDGIITFEEFKAAMEQMNFPEKEMQEIFDSIDVNKNGIIMYTEFIAAALEALGRIEEERVADAFVRLDTNDSGYISKQNLREFLGTGGTSERIDQLIKESDTDNDGRISYQEFLGMFRKDTKKLVKQLTGMGAMMNLKQDDGLLGLDTKIPGGVYDSSMKTPNL